jgi:hypothetical protein
MKPLYNEHETYTEDGSEIFNEMTFLIHSFIKDKIQIHNSIELNQICLDALGYVITLERTKKSLKDYMKE